MDRQTLRNWVIPFNQHGPDGLVNKLAPSRTWVDDCTRECLALIADTSISGFRKAHLARGRARSRRSTFRRLDRQKLNFHPRRGIAGTFISLAPN